MNASLDPTKLKGYDPKNSYQKPLPDLIPARHVCGEIVHANLEGEYVLFYTRHDQKGTGHAIYECPRCEYPLTMDWMRRLYYVEPMPYDTAVRTMSRVCSNCWGWQLEMSGTIKVHDEETGLDMDYRLVTCKDCGVETRGFVTSRYVGFAREKDRIDYGRAIYGIAEALELEQGNLPVKLPTRAKRSISANLVELGF